MSRSNFGDSFDRRCEIGLMVVPSGRAPLRLVGPVFHESKAQQSRSPAHSAAVSASIPEGESQRWYYTATPIPAAGPQEGLACVDTRRCDRARTLFPCALDHWWPDTKSWYARGYDAYAVPLCIIAIDQGTGRPGSRRSLLLGHRAVALR